MKQEYLELLYRLRMRFDVCYANYIAEALKLDKEQIFETASEIAAVKETYTEICFWLELSMCGIVLPSILIKEPMDERDAANLLNLEDPLKYLAMKWWFHTLGGKADFHDFYREERMK